MGKQACSSVICFKCTKVTGCQVSVEILLLLKPMGMPQSVGWIENVLFSLVWVGSTWSVKGPNRKKKKKKKEKKAKQSSCMWIYISCLSQDIHFLLSPGVGWRSWFPGLSALTDVYHRFTSVSTLHVTHRGASSLHRVTSSHVCLSMYLWLYVHVPLKNLFFNIRYFLHLHFKCYPLSWEALPVPDIYRSGCSPPSIGRSTGSPMKELEKGPSEES